MAQFRTERDTMGEMQVPVDALYGASTARAIENFPIAHEPVPAAIVHAFGSLKAACAQANLDLGKLDKPTAEAIIAVAVEVSEVYPPTKCATTTMRALWWRPTVAPPGVATTR